MADFENIIVKDEPIDIDEEYEEYEEYEAYEGMSSEPKIQLPNFDAENPDSWFNLVEYIFEIEKLISDEEKFNKICEEPEPKLLPLIREVQSRSTNGNKYSDFKAKVHSLFPETMESILHQRLKCLKLKNRSPSQFMKLLQVTSGGKLSTSATKSLFIEQMPESIQRALSESAQEDLEMIANYADMALELMQSEKKLAEKKAAMSGKLHMTRTIAKLSERVNELKKIMSNNLIYEEEPENHIRLNNFSSSDEEDFENKDSPNKSGTTDFGDHNYFSSKSQHERRITPESSSDEVEEIDIKSRTFVRDRHKKSELERYLSRDWRKVETKNKAAAVQQMQSSQANRNASYKKRAPNSKSINGNDYRAVTHSYDTRNKFKVIQKKSKQKNPRKKSKEERERSDDEMVQRNVDERIRRAVLRQKAEFLKSHLPGLTNYEKTSMNAILTHAKEYLDELVDTMQKNKVQLQNLQIRNKKLKKVYWQLTIPYNGQKR